MDSTPTTTTALRSHAVDLRTAPRIMDTLDSYTAYLAGQRKLRPRAIETYRRAVVRVATWLGDEATVAALTADAIGRYQVAKAHLLAASVAKELSAIRSYSRWCMRAQLRADDPTMELEWPKRTEPIPRALTARELRQLDAILAAAVPVLDRKGRRRVRR